MGGKIRKYRVTITITEPELTALDDILLTWTLCKKHNAQVWDPKTGKVLTEQEIFKMQDECSACARRKLRKNRTAGRIMAKLFNAVDKRIKDK